jgi:FtsZ-binding cell division protein ZapB
MKDNLNGFDIGEVDSAFENQDLSQVDMDLLQEENDLLRDAIRNLKEENAKLKQRANNIVLESFEGEGRKFRDKISFGDDIGMGTMTGDEIAEGEAAMWCDELVDGSCPLEPTISFGEALRDRAYWLVGLLIMQSLSGIILIRNEALLADHPVIIYFLTMLVGAGGNAGNQASVRGGSDSC